MGPFYTKGPDEFHDISNVAVSSVELGWDPVLCFHCRKIFEKEVSEMPFNAF